MSQNSIRSATSSAFVPINSHNGEVDSKPQATTRLDKAVEGVKRLRSNADILNHASTVIDEVIESINRVIYNGKLKDIAKLNQVKTTLTLVSRNVQSDAAILSPIPSMGYAIKRKQTQERRAVSPDLTTFDAIQSFNNSSNAPFKRRSNRSTLKQPPPKRLKTKDIDIEYPAPSNGKQYMPQEVVNILSTNIKYQGKIINDMVSNNVIPLKRRSVYDMMKKIADGGDVPTRWNDRGRRPIATEREVQQITEVLTSKPGCSIGQTEVRNALVDLKKQRLIDNGIAPVGVVAPSTTTVRNYTAMAASQSNVSVSKVTKPKTFQRYAAEQSIRSAIVTT